MSETNYGVIADRLAWEVPLNPTATIELPPVPGLHHRGAPEESEHTLRVRPPSCSAGRRFAGRADDSSAAIAGLRRSGDEVFGDGPFGVQGPIQFGDRVGLGFRTAVTNPVVDRYVCDVDTGVCQRLVEGEGPVA